MEEKIVECKICGIKFEGKKNPTNSLGTHIRFKHKDYDIKKYYDEFLKKPDEGTCPICGKQTGFQSFVKGYYKHCDGDCKYKSNDVINKRNKTIFDTYGVVNISQNEDIKKKKKETLAKTFGSYENYIDALSEHCKENNVMFNDEVKKKHKEKMNENVLERTIASRLSRKVNYYNTYLRRLENKQLALLSSYDDYMNYKAKLKCNRCGRVWEDDYVNVRWVSCGCHRSYREVELENFIRANCDYDIVSNKRFYYDGKKFFEIDIFIPELNLGFEYNGVFFHSNAKLDDNYHQRKKDFFTNLGIDCIFVYGYDWSNNNDIIKSIILRRLNTLNFIDINDCKVVNDIDVTDFTYNNSLHDDITDLNYSFLYNDYIVCNVGISDNIIKYIDIKNNINIDINGVVNYISSIYDVKFIEFSYDYYNYDVNNFCFHSLLEPTYKYFLKNKETLVYDYDEIYHKLNIDESLNEFENMKNNNYNVIYNAGTKVLKKIGV